tara:strand:+ start:483 stop:908 length:426 start_codon:yes stop_codon:yes gene_type:complete
MIAAVFYFMPFNDNVVKIAGMTLSYAQAHILFNILTCLFGLFSLLSLYIFFKTCQDGKRYIEIHNDHFTVPYSKYSQSLSRIKYNNIDSLFFKQSKKVIFLVVITKRDEKYEFPSIFFKKKRLFNDFCQEIKSNVYIEKEA